MSPIQILPQERAANMAAINAWLEARSLGPPLRRLGDWTQGEIEFTRVLDAYENGFITVVLFECIKPGGIKDTHVDVFNKNSNNSNGSVLIPLVNDKVLVEREWRPTLGEHLVGCLRGFAPRLDGAQVTRAIDGLRLCELPLGPDEQKAAQVLAEHGTISSISSVGPFYENSGTHAGHINVYVVAIDCPDEEQLLRHLKRIAGSGKKYLLWTRPEVDAEFARGRHAARWVDGFTAAALYCAANFVPRVAL